MENLNKNEIPIQSWEIKTLPPDVDSAAKFKKASRVMLDRFNREVEVKMSVNSWYNQGFANYTLQNADFFSVPRNYAASSQSTDIMSLAFEIARVIEKSGLLDKKDDPDITNAQKDKIYEEAYTEGAEDAKSEYEEEIQELKDKIAQYETDEYIRQMEAHFNDLGE